jgi:hypothetical protein
MPQVKVPDVIILHGMSIDLVTSLVELTSSLEIDASSIINLPSMKRPQEEKVDYYIGRCRIPLILVTQDELGKDPKARPNVYDEIARCRKLKPKDAIVLQEKGVELPSNVVGRLVVIPFEKNAFHKAIPQLIKEFSQRGLPKTKAKIFGIQKLPSEELTSQSKQVLRDFVHEMDEMWEFIDKAWNVVYRKNHTHAESNVTTALDKFFVCYWTVFRSLVESKKSRVDLKSVCNTQLVHARGHAATAWEYVAESAITWADETAKQMGNIESASRYSNILDGANHELHMGKEKSSPFAKIEHFRNAKKLADEYLSKVKGGREKR